MKKILLGIIIALTSSTTLAKNISVVIPFSAGGGTDRAWRLLHSMIQPDLKKDQIDLVTEYRPGAGGALGVSYVANTADQSTNFLFASSAMSIAPAANPGSVKYQPQDFQMLGYFGAFPLALFVPTMGADNMKNFIQACRSRSLNFSSTGTGSTTHSVIETMLKKINCSAVAVYYKGTPPMVPDLISGRIDFAVDFVTGPFSPMVQDRKAKNIMVIGRRRLATLPDVPASSEYDIHLDEFKSWQVFLVNAKANVDDVSRVQKSVTRALSQPENINKFRDIGLDGAGERVSTNFLADNFSFYRRFFIENNLVEK